MLGIKENSGRDIHLPFLGKVMVEVHFMKFNVPSQFSKGTNDLCGGLIIDVVLALFGKEIERDGMW
jgi:hypothetical protein